MNNPYFYLRSDSINAGAAKVFADAAIFPAWRS
jgi:hypothetical protein